MSTLLRVHDRLHGSEMTRTTGSVRHVGSLCLNPAAVRETIDSGIARARRPFSFPAFFLAICAPLG